MRDNSIHFPPLSFRPQTGSSETTKDKYMYKNKLFLPKLAALSSQKLHEILVVSNTNRFFFNCARFYIMTNFPSKRKSYVTEMDDVYKKTYELSRRVDMIKFTQLSFKCH